MAGEKRFVNRAALGDLMTQRQHQRHVGVGANRNPLGVNKFRAVIPHRADVDHRRAFGRQLHQRRFQAVLPCAPRGDLGVFQRQPTKGDKNFGMFHHLRPFGDAPGQRHVGANHIGQEELRGAPAVVTLLINTAAALKVEATNQGAGMVNTSGR
ncbi:Uncharacterised protein [Pantoea agglomerans]|uniref:Uncharacterized protein n=1 Tax=Enterobacter agglomerans TaxID=549 RepID=A0A379AM68_ENTAG|nr:Uncharacterised protein [Pantoea agglomerans]